jgi:hypothetical protein
MAKFTCVLAVDGMIHRNYNGWVQNLDRAMRAQSLAP